jgi:hypothetical protein
VTALEAVRGELLGRRERLAGLAVTVRESQLVELLQQVDSALERLDGGTWGRCSVCLGHVEDDRLSADPLVTVCLECLSPAERKALERDPSREITTTWCGRAPKTSRSTWWWATCPARASRPR